MNLKRAISAVCAAAVLVSTSLSDLPAQFSAYSHAYAALTEFRYEFSQSPVAMAVQSADDGSLKCEVVTRFPADGVTNGVTTVAELRRLYSGLTVNGFEFSNSSLEGLTAEDIHTSISVLSGTDSNSYDGWYAVTDKDTLDFADMPADNDSKVVQSLSFHIYIDGGAVSRLGMKLGDRIYLNSDGSGFSYYTHTEPSGPITMTVTEATWENNSGMSCAYNSDFEIPGVTKGVTTFGELKALYDGIKVEGYEFMGSTVEGMTETDLVPTIVLMTGSDWNWKAVYNTTKMNFSSDLADVADDDIVQSIAFSISVQDDSFAKLGLKIGDSFVVNPEESEPDYYVHSWRSGPLSMTVEEPLADGGSGMSCVSSNTITIPGVDWGRVTAGELKKLYKGIKVDGFAFSGSSVDGMTESDVTTLIAVMTGDKWNWNAAYGTDTITFSDTLKDVPDSDVIDTVMFNIALLDDSMIRLGLKIGDTVILNPDDVPAETYNIHLSDGTLLWDEADGADHYEVFCGGSLLDNCIANNSVGFKLAMSLNGYKPGRYQLDVYAVYADETRKLLGSVDYDYGVTVSDKNIFAYSENDDGTVTITGGNIVTPKLEIPAELEGKKVSAIGMNAFTGNNVITDLVIPEGVTTLNWYSFNTCKNLETVTLPDSLEFIDSWAFERCSRLKTINVPANVTRINGGAFAQNSSMTSITCDPANKNYVSVNGVLFTKDMKELVAYPGGIQGGYTVPATVNHIGDAAFYGALGLDSVTILGNLDFIGFEAFAECSKLTDVAIRDGVNYVGYWAFRGCNGIKSLTVPQSVTNIGNQAFGFAYADQKMSGFSLRGYKDSAVNFYAIRHDIPFICIGEASEDNKPFDKDNAKESEVETNPDTPEDEKITTIIATPAFNMKDKSEAGVGLDLSKVKVKAKEIYDEEGIKRAEEALGTEISANKKYSLLDLTLINGDKDYSNGYDGLVEVVIPIPKGHRGKTFYCYRLLDDGTKELIPGKQREDSYVVYLEHFSVYAFVADEEHTCVFSESWANDKSGHWHECACGKTTEPESHIAGDWITDVEAAAAEDGHRYKECTICGYIMEEETFKAEKTAAPVISPNGGTFTGSQTVTITCAAPDAAIYYTTDGSTPTVDSAKYSGGFTLTASATVKAFAVSADAAASDIVTAVFTKKSGGSSRPSSAKTEETKPAFNGKETSWADIAGSIAKLAEGGAVTISLNGNYTVPAEVMKQIADKKIKATFVVDSVKSWVIDGAQIKNAASTDLTLIQTQKLKTGGLAGTEGVQFTVSSADIPAGIAVSFKANFAGRFANLYKSVDGKLVFMGCAKLDSTGKATVPGIDGKGDYAVMLSELSALPGDMNNDGILNALDASEILKYAVGISAGANLAAADINGDGTVNASDAAAVLRRAVG
ncbi:MAG: leucine-rich repeat protein [Eubacterium sp.]|nr:leucine-rich repeat protein [Eubacterium sp.]